MGVIIIREMVGTSPRSWSDAARQAVATASRTVRNIRTVEVVKSTAGVENGEVGESRVEHKIGLAGEGSTTSASGCDASAPATDPVARGERAQTRHPRHR